MWRKYFFVQEICDSIIAHKYFFKFQFERMIETHSIARSRTLILDSCDCARYIEKDMKMGTNIHLYVLYGIKYACRQKRCTLSLRMPLQIEWLQCAVCTHVTRYRSKFTFLVEDCYHHRLTSEPYYQSCLSESDIEAKAPFYTNAMFQIRFLLA